MHCCLLFSVTVRNHITHSVISTHLRSPPFSSHQSSAHLRLCHESDGSAREERGKSQGGNSIFWLCVQEQNHSTSPEGTNPLSVPVLLSDQEKTDVLIILLPKDLNIEVSSNRWEQQRKSQMNVDVEAGALHLRLQSQMESPSPEVEFNARGISQSWKCLCKL